ncbi:MAG: hypothetical protein ACLQVI_20355 [Polyangiaceae bacterium]|jgi:hypothetical protein
MSFDFVARTRFHIAVPLVLVPFAAIPACGKSSSGTTGSPCAALPEDAGFPSYEIPASGTVGGSGVSAVFCNVGIEMQETSGPDSPALLYLDTSSPETSSSVTLPAGAVQGTLAGSIQVGLPTPGVYPSSSSSSCGTLTFSYGEPTVPGVDCTTDGSFTCPTGCTLVFVCPTSSPCCVPLATTYVYQAASAATCNGGGAQTPMGSWTVTLTSVSDEDGGEGSPVYLPHGKLEATLLGTTGTTATVDLALTF